MRRRSPRLDQTAGHSCDERLGPNVSRIGESGLTRPSARRPASRLRGDPGSFTQPWKRGRSRDHGHGLRIGNQTEDMCLRRARSGTSPDARSGGVTREALRVIPGGTPSQA